MDPNKIKPGDFLTWVFEDSGIFVARVISLERYKFQTEDKLNGKVCGAQALVFPHWSEDNRSGREQFARISKYYLERASYSSEAEVMAWLKSAMEYEDDLRAMADNVSKCICRKISLNKIIKMDDLDKYETARLPPKIGFNWLWGKLKMFKLYDHKKGTVLLWGNKIWKQTKH